MKEGPNFFLLLLYLSFKRVIKSKEAEKDMLGHLICNLSTIDNFLMNLSEIYQDKNADELIRCQLCSEQ